MMIDRWGTHKHLRKEDLNAAFLVQVIAWIEESHYWQTKKGNHNAVTCAWCGAKRANYYASVTDIPDDSIKICPENPVIKGMMGDPNVHYTLSRIKP